MESTAIAQCEVVNTELLEALQHVIRWYDQLGPADIARYQTIVTKASAQQEKGQNNV